MDIVAALSTISQAIKIAKDLRDLDRDLDSATYKAEMVELYGALANVKMALTDAHTEIHKKDQEIRELQQIIENLKSGDSCPICEIGRMKVSTSKPHPTFGEVGVLERALVCQNPDCSHTEKHIYDPMNLTGTSS